MNDATVSSSLRALDYKTSNGLHRILVVSEPSLMRGTDFRAPANGICLIVKKSFDCERDFKKALTCVGRYGDKCERLLTHDLDPVEKKEAFVAESSSNEVHDQWLARRATNKHTS